MKKTRPIWMTFSILAVLILLPSSCRVAIEPDGVVQAQHLKWIWRGFFIGPFELLVNPYTTQNGVPPSAIGWTVGIAIVLLGLMASRPLKPNGITAALSALGVIFWVLMGFGAAMAWK